MTVSLSQITRGRVEQAPRVLLYSPPKIGKTMFAAQIPNVVFIAAEQGTQEFNVARVPVLNKCAGSGPQHRCGWSTFHEWIRVFSTDKHEYKALAIDTLDWLESVLFSHLVATDPKGRQNIVEAHGGYGKAYDIAVDEWRRVSTKLDELNAKGMTIVLLAHSQIKKFQDPQSEGFDQHKLKMHDRGAGFWMEWVDAILFANHEIVQNRETGGFVGTGRRVIYTEPPTNFAYIAGNRFGLPSKIDLDFGEFDKAMQLSTPLALEKELESVLADRVEVFEVSGVQKKKSDVRGAFKAALDRRAMRRIIEAAEKIPRKNESSS